MFFALSKILPLLVYPIGLACLALLVGFILAWRRSRWTPLPIALAFTVLLLASNAAVSDTLVRSLEWQYLPPEPVPEADAIVLLGGLTERGQPPRPGVELNEEGDRALYAAELYLAGKAPVLLVSGGHWDYLPPPEAEDVMKILLKLGVPPAGIVLEPRSVNTYENAIFSKEILNRLGSKRILLVTSAMHMPRSMAIFRKQGIEAIAAPTDYQVATDVLGPKPAYIHITRLLPEARYLARTTRALKEYIGLVIY
ncbi:MAG: YdcF family protein, partial [Cyanobacteria bacterium J06641_5]